MGLLRLSNWGREGLSHREIYPFDQNIAIRINNLQQIVLSENFRENLMASLKT